MLLGKEPTVAPRTSYLPTFGKGPPVVPLTSPINAGFECSHEERNDMFQFDHDKDRVIVITCCPITFHYGRIQILTVDSQRDRTQVLPLY